MKINVINFVKTRKIFQVKVKVNIRNREQTKHGIGRMNSILLILMNFNLFSVKNNANEMFMI